MRISNLITHYNESTAKQLKPANTGIVYHRFDMVEISQKAVQKYKSESLNTDKINKELYKLAMSNIDRPDISGKSGKISAVDEASIDLNDERTLDITAEKMVSDLLYPWWEE